MTRITSGWTVQEGSQNVTVLTFAPSRPTMMPRRRSFRWRPSPTSSPKEHAPARARRRRDRKTRQRLRQRPRRRPRWTPPQLRTLRRRRHLSQLPLRRRHLLQPPRLRWTCPLQHLQQLQPRPQPQHPAEIPRESVAPPHACWNIARWHTKTVIWNSRTTSSTASSGCYASSDPRAYPHPRFCYHSPVLVFCFRFRFPALAIARLVLTRISL